MSKFISSADGYFELTKAGYIALTVIMILVIVAVAIIIGIKQKAGKITAKKLAVAGVTLALGFVTSYFKVYELPWGGAVTAFSMFFICYIGYLYGVTIGFMAAFAYSVLQFIQGGGTYILTPFQACCDYFFAFTALGVASFWYKKDYKRLIIAYVVAILARGLFHTIGGYIYWMDYMPDYFPKSLAFIYPICYNYSYILIEGIATVVVLLLPPVKKGIKKIQQITME